MSIIVNGKKVDEIEFRYGVFVDHNEETPTLKGGYRQTPIRKSKLMNFDNNNGGVWPCYFSIPIITPPSESVQYKIEITETSINVWANDLRHIIATGSSDDFWNKTTGVDIRVFDEFFDQNYFWVEKFDIQNKHAIIWVKLKPNQRNINIAYGNRNCFESKFNKGDVVFINVIDGLVGCWHFNEGSGNTVYDSSGNNNNGTIQGTVNWIDGYYGKALEFDGQTCVVVPNNTSLNPSEISVVARVYVPTNAIERFDDIVNKELWTPDGSNLKGYWLRVDENRSVNFWVGNRTNGNGSAKAVPGGSNSFNFDTWYMFTGTYDGLYLKIYVDCVLKNSMRYDGGIGSSSKVVTIGGLGGNPNFKGIIDEVMIFNKALTNEEIKQIYQYGGQGSYNGHLLVGYKRLSNDLQFGQIIKVTL